jgi:sulfur carrier protein
MKLVVNGETKEFNVANLSISDLLKIENVKNPDVVTVQLNGKFFSKEQYTSTILKDGDEVEFLYFRFCKV